MRTIKFRAWNGESMSTTFKIHDMHTTFDDCSTYRTIRNEADTWELMQYTGLKDKNHKEIYEGDILTDGKFKWVVEFIDGAFWAKRGRTVENIKVIQRKRWIAMQEDCIEVIGNIYENPELLEQ